MKNPNFTVILVVVALAITLPFVAAALSGGQEPGVYRVPLESD